MKIRSFPDGSYLEFAKGRFDNFCIYHTDKDGKRQAPRDCGYFTDIKNLSKTHTKKKLYHDFVRVYEKTNFLLDKNVFTLIDEEIAPDYGTDAPKVSLLYSILYMGMLAEENKAHSILGKRIKRLGMHTLLIADKSPEFAANSSRNRRWRELDAECKACGF